MKRALVLAAGGGIGDAFLATVVARALRQRYDGVDMLVKAAAAPVLDGNPDLAEVLVDDGAPLRALTRHIRERRYAASVTTWATARSALVPFLAGIPVRVGQARRLYSALFTKRIVVRSELGDRTTHWTQILLDYARALDCDTTDPQPRVALDADDARTADDVLACIRAGDAFAILHPTRAIANENRRWPPEPFARLANVLVERYGLPVLVTGGVQDREFGDRVLALARSDVGGQRRAPIVDISGATALRTFTALAARARFVVAMDSGPMHLAAATGTPTVGIFALHSDEPDRWAPLGPRVAVVRGTYPCPPAHRKETCPDFPCVRELALPPVLGALDELLGA